MLKKLFKIGMLAGALLLACSVNAQEKEYAAVYPQYSWQSNWSYGGALTWSWQRDNRNTAIDPINQTAFGLNFFAEKEVNYYFDLRAMIELPGVLHKWKSDNGDEGFNHFATLGIGMKWGYLDFVKGYDPERKWHPYISFATGVASHFVGNGMKTLSQIIEAELFSQAGLGIRYQLSDKWSCFLEYDQDVINEIPAFFFKKGGWHHTNGSFLLGLMWHHGPTQEDLDLIAQRALLTQENFDAKDKEIEGLRNDLRDAEKRENALKNRISELEANQNNYGGSRNSGGTIVRGGGVYSDNEVADSLQKIIDNYETNKHNFYALPFSILYGLDEYTVPEDQMNKVNAIAQVMKDNKDVNFEIIGYCDYSGSDSYNQKLSEKRAEYVKKLLVKKGVNEDRLTTSGKGKSMSFGDIKNAINRRVSFYRTNK